MSIAIQSALAGLVTAGQRLEQGAAQIASGSGQPIAQAPESGTGRSNAAARVENTVPDASVAAAGQNAPSLTDGLFAMKQAEIQYTASAKMLGALNDMQKETLDILS
jgi:hypothetical protein